MKIMNKITGIFLLFLLLLFTNCTQDKTKKESTPINTSEEFSFAFLTDVHLNKDNRGNGNEGLMKALENVKTKNVDFVIFGGDNADLNILEPEEETIADSLDARFKSIVDKSGLKAYFTIGNHDHYNTFNKQPDTTGIKMFEKYFGKTTYSFDHKGVHFVVLNSVPRDDAYYIRDEQFQWLKEDLDRIEKDIPVVVVTHVPFQSLYYPAVEGKVVQKDMLDNFKQVWDLLLDYNVKLILQGHQHLYEDLYVKNTRFLTGGAVSGAWWKGALFGTEEGYVLVKVDPKQNLSWKYINYEWEVRNK